MFTTVTNQELIRAAIEAMGRSYSPYSHFQVGDRKSVV